VVVGAPLSGRVLIIDDVITAGTSVRESVELIRAQGATTGRRTHRARSDGARPGRCLRGRGGAESYGIPVVAIATLDDLMRFIAGRPELERWQDSVSAYRAEYGARAA
jgi:orotate phosphoribosyltransferase